MKISLCITNYNRTSEVLQSFIRVADDSRIDEIVIMDDASEYSTYLAMIAGIEKLNNPKIKYFRQYLNVGMLRNKAAAIQHATNDYCIIFDSDNVLDKNYLDALHRVKWSPDMILMPDFAKPHFDYRRFKAQIITRRNVKGFMKKQMFDCLMNTCNYFVHRETYLKVFEENESIKGTDTIWFNYLWLRSGKSFYVVPQMDYQHTVHDGSGWLKDAEYNSTKGEEIKKMILAL